MYRDLFDDLVIWKNSTNRKPLIIEGARQVGKTWLMKHFGSLEFENVVYLNFESSLRLQEVFVQDFNIERLIAVFEIETKKKINPTNTLLIFDEIQEATKGLTALKYFFEQAPQLYIIAAGSLLGVSMQQKNSFPVGKVDFLKLYPMSFLEFLANVGEEQLANEIKQNNWNVIDSFHEKLVSILRLYYFVGGMPEAVLNYTLNKDLNAVRSIQEKILIGYENDFAKHAPNTIVPKIRLVWQNILTQLAKQNKKFIYGQIKKGARAKDFEEAINWLVNAGLVLKVSRVENIGFPLVSNADIDVFKLFLLDIGLLNAKGNLDASILLEKNNILKEFKGAITEQFVCEQLICKLQLFYWSALNATAEIDFVLQKQNQVVPVEVKAEENLKAKSLKLFVDKYNTPTAIRASMSKYRKEEWLTNIPLYAIASISN